MTAVAALCSLGVLLLAACGWGVVRHYNGRVHHVDLSLAAAGRPAAARGGTENILLVGSDSRAGLGGQFGEVEGQRSDTTILAHLDRDGSTTMVSFPRDLWVTIPSYQSGGVTHAEQRSKLNSAFSLGGPALLVRTIEGLTGLRVDHYVQVDFGGFQAITDALGGVTVCVKELPASLRARGFDNLHDRMSGWSGQVGANRLDGAQALAFVRQRYGLPEGDLDRIRRQQQFLSVVFHAMTAPSTLANPVRVRDVLDATTSALTVDRGTSLTDLEPLALRMRTLTGGGSGFETVPATPATRAGQSVLLVDPAKLAAFLAPLRPAATAAPGGLQPRAAASTSVTRAARPAALPAGGAPAAATQPATGQSSGGSSCTY
ncbi:LCP family protein [Pseudofrankia inefficax]|uniref:LCP family protein n=1 Tax=Pseudofrankia inefficax (strain DSM 45817 / CECT 9037 / DDB 130130 / EuI1c) TaxID=298654 RepID=UPI0002E7716B|nr:LCP family protein [Pseudofrankia inefficax]